MEILVYSEKSSDGKEIAKGLSLDGNVIIQTGKAFTKGIDGNNITVFWGAGHFYSLKTPKALGFEYSLKSLPLLPDYIEYGEDNSFEHKKALLNNAINLLKNTKFDILVYAGDAGREGLAILDRLYIASNCKINREYIWKGDCSADEIRKLWKNRLSGKDKLVSGEIIDGLTESAHQRAIADWKIGMNFSQLYTLYYKLLNEESINFRVGRVITPTLNMIHYREEEINKFKPEKYYKLLINWKEGFSGYLFLDLNDENSFKFSKKEDVYKINTLFANQKSGIVNDIIKKETLGTPSYGLNGSNIKLSRELKITPKKVLEYVEDMYNNDGVMSYPRVESTHITEGEFENIKKTICFLKDNISKIPIIYHDVINYIIKNEFNLTIPVVNNKKIIEGHGAFHIKITKGEISKANIIKLINGIEHKSIIFKKILNNNLQFFLPKSVNTNFNIIVGVGNYNFVTKKSYLTRKGYKVLEEVKLDTIPSYMNNIGKGDTLYIDSFDVEDGESRAPIRINTDNLMMYMMHPNKLFEIKKEEEDLYNIIEYTQGIGQPSTRQIIIENLIIEEYVILKQGEFYITEKGIKILNTIDDKIKDILLTAKLEKGLNDIAFNHGDDCKNILVSYINRYITFIVNKKVTSDIIEKYNEKFGKFKQKIELKSPEGYTLYMKEDKKNKGNYYVTSDDNLGGDGKPLFYSLYDPLINNFKTKNSLCNTNQLCPKCVSKMFVFRSSKNERLYIECTERKNKKCDYVSLYDINNDLIIKDDKIFLDDIKCEKCGGRIHIKKSIKDGNYYALCEYNNKEKKCGFIKQYDRKNNSYMLPKYMRNSKNTGLIYKNKEIYENEQTYFSMDGSITVWKNIGGIELDKDIIVELFNKGKTANIIKGFKSQKGNVFSARLRLIENMIKYEF